MVTSATANHGLAVGLVLLGIGVASVALLGPLVGGIIRYHISPGAENQVTGGDVAALLVVAPLSIAAGLLVRRRHPAGTVLALGPAGYALYTALQLVLGGDVARYPGNSERFFPLFLGLIVLSAWILVRAWSGVDHVSLPPFPPALERFIPRFLLIVAAFLTVGLHLPGLLDAWSAAPSSPEYLADPAVFWVVKLMDLGIVVPVLISVAIGMLRARSFAPKAVHGVVGWTATLGTAVAGMAIVMQVSGDPAASGTNTLVFVLVASIAWGIAILTYRPLFQRTINV